MICIFIATLASAQTWSNLNVTLNGSPLAVFVTPQGKVMVAGTGAYSPPALTMEKPGHK